MNTAGVLARATSATVDAPPRHRARSAATYARSIRSQYSSRRIGISAAGAPAAAPGPAMCNTCHAEASGAIRPASTSKASLRVAAPVLPPRTSSVFRSPARPKCRRASSREAACPKSRMGQPIARTLCRTAGGNVSDVSSNCVKMTSARRASRRLAFPGIASGLSMAQRTESRAARQTSGAAAKPPRPRTAAGFRSRINVRASDIEPSQARRNPGASDARRGSGRTGCGTTAYGSGSRIRRSTARSEQAKTIATSPDRRSNCSATATPGYTWPPVPPPAKR